MHNHHDNSGKDMPTRPEPSEKGGGYRGGPRRSTGRGPQPARHIPWPELFKHHISLIEGHFKMIDMVRKHTVEGTGNHRTLCDMLDRCKTMLYDSKHISRTFVPPPSQRDKVPLGSSSVSMYPGYSPADHVYGEAASEAGKWIAAARAQGVELRPVNDIEYEVGQGKGTKRKTLAGIQAAKAAKEKTGSGSGSGSDAPASRIDRQDEPSKAPETTSPDSKPANGPTNPAQPAFFVDTKPTPVNLPFTDKKPPKRVSPDAEPTEDTKPKKEKKKHEGETPAPPAPGLIERIDITAEVDARMKEKEERRKRKEEKKRKRESEEHSTIHADATNGNLEEKKPKKKKAKKTGDAKGPEEASKKRPADMAEDSRDAESKKKRKKHGGAS